MSSRLYLKLQCVVSASLVVEYVWRYRLNSLNITLLLANLLLSAVRMEELMCIKKELTVIKSQIDELLDSLERMDPQSQELSGKTLILSSSDALCKGGL